MAMARLISQALTHGPKSPLSSFSISPRILTQRHRSGKPQTTFHFIDVDADPSSSSSPSASSSTSSSSITTISEVDAINDGIRKLEEVIQNIVARRSAPDWLPFIPGSSYWVPPTNLKSHPTYGGVVEVIGRLSTAARLQSEGQIANPTSSEFLSEDETMSFSSSRGWPSTSYYIEGSSPTYPVPMEVAVEVELKVLDDSKGGSTNEDEEG